MTTTTSHTAAKAPRMVANLPHEEREKNPQAGFGSLETPRGRLPLTALDVSAHITGLTAEVLVRQTFVNLFSEHLEATYIFPLPDRAAVTSFRLTVAGRTIVGDLKERGQARAEYDQAIQAGHRAAIAEEDRSGTFNLRVGNLPPLEQATVELVLVGPLVFVDGEATFRFPLVVAPRYVPGSFLDVPPVGAGTAYDTDLTPDASRVTPPVLLPGFPNPVRLGLSVEFDPAGLATPAGGWAGALKSSLHGMLEDVQGNRVRLRVQPGERLNRDFILRFPAAERCVQTALVASPARSDRPGTFSLTLVPPVDRNLPPRARDVVFVLDRSGSMQGWKMVAARRALGRMIDTLTERDRFAVLAFDDSLESPPDAADRMLAGTDRDRWQTLEWLGTVDSRGGTEMGPALEKAVQLLAATSAEGRGEKPDSILVLVTDGQVAGEDVLLKTLQKAAGARMPRIFALGIDRAVNAGFLKRLADLGGGGNDLVESEERLDEVMDRIHRAIATPALVDVKLEPLGCEWIGDSLTPSRLPDLFAGTPLTILGRFLGDAQGIKLRVHARDAAGKPWQHDVQAGSLAVREPREGSKQPDMLLNLWGRAKVRELEDRYATGVDSDLKGLAARIVKVSLESHVLSRFTAYIAVDLAEIVNAGGKKHEVVQAVELPEGWAEGAAKARGGSNTAMVMCAAAMPMKPADKTSMSRKRAAPAAPPPPSPSQQDESLGAAFGGMGQCAAEEVADAKTPHVPSFRSAQPPSGAQSFGKPQTPGSSGGSLKDMAKAAFDAVADAAGAALNALRPQEPAAEKQLQRRLKEEKGADKRDRNAQREAGGGGSNDLATTLRLLLDEPAPHVQRVLLQKLLEEMGRVSLPAADATLQARLVELRTEGEKFAKRFDAGASNILTSAEFRAWTEHLITLLTAMNPAEPVTLPERPEFWV